MDLCYWLHSWALSYLKIAPEISWLFGATGHAFLINMSKDGSCPSGPTAWETAHFYDLGKNISYHVFTPSRKLPVSQASPG